MTDMTAMLFTRCSSSLSFLTRELRNQVTGSSGGYDYAKLVLCITLQKRQGKAPATERLAFVCQHCLAALVNSFLNLFFCGHKVRIKDLDEVYCQDHFPVKEALVVACCNSSS